MPIVEHVLADGWRHPVCVDDWGVTGWYMRATSSPWGTWGHRDQDPAERLEAGKRIRVRWADGSTSVEVLRSKPRSRTVGDHCGSYGVEDSRLYITETSVVKWPDDS